MKQCVVLACLSLLICLCTFAQDAPKAPADKPAAAPTDTAKVGGAATVTPGNKPPDKNAKADAKQPDAKPGDAKQPEPKKEEAPPPPPPPPQPAGDTVTLKSGKVLSRVQVISRSPSDIEVDVGDGITMRIPRKQIADIKYDDFEPSKHKAAAPAETAGKTEDVIRGSKITAEVSAKLTAPLPEPPLKYDNQDLVTILGDLSKRLEITIVVDDPVKALPDKQRLWSFQSTPGMTLMTLLQDNLLKTFANLGVVYQYDKLLVTTKEAADAIAAKDAQAEEKPADEKAAPPKPPADEKPAPDKKPPQEPAPDKAPK